MGNPDPGFSAREQNRFWTSVFLFGTAAILYTQRDTPFVYMTDRQDDLANYHSRESVDRILLKTFGLPPDEETDTETDASSTEESSSDVDVNPQVEVDSNVDSDVSSTENIDSSDDTTVNENAGTPENSDSTPSIDRTQQTGDTNTPPATEDEQ